ncbi:MAG: hypothetical protein ACLFU8_04805 [Anaerolineales bacterium]
MSGFNTKTRVRAATPLEAVDRRFLPSVLVTTVAGRLGPAGALQGVRLRPISVVEQAPEGNRWYAIPDVTRDTLSKMTAAGLGVMLISMLALLLIHLLRD